MMVSIEAVGLAISSFIEREIIPKMDEGKIKMGAVAMFAPKWVEHMIHENKFILESNGMLIGEMVDLDCASRLAHSLIDKYGEYRESIMKVTVTIGKRDIDKIVEIAMNHQN